MLSDQSRTSRRPQGPSELVRPVPVDPTGIDGPTRGKAQGPRWRMTSRGFYVPASVNDDMPEQRILEQSVRLPEGGAVTGWAALRLHGATWVDGLAPDGRSRLPVPLALGRGRNIRGDRAVALHRDPLPASEVVVLRGIPCTVAERATFDAMRCAPDLTEAVVAVDMAAAGEVTSVRRMQSYVEERARWRGVPRARSALSLASDTSWSPNETRMRMVWLREAGLPPPLVNRPVFDLSGRLLGYPDLLDPSTGLVGEYDGADHRRAARHASDVGREDLFRRQGLEVFRVTGPDLRTPGRVRARMLEALARARRIPAELRQWTASRPSGWQQGPTLDDVLDHRDFMNEARRAREADGHPT